LARHPETPGSRFRLTERIPAQAWIRLSRVEAAFTLIAASLLAIKRSTPGKAHTGKQRGAHGVSPCFEEPGAKPGDVAEKP
jgi:hypothetical protein